MTSFNSYLDALKPLAKSFKEKAAKLTDAVDDTLKKTQENLEKKRIKVVEASESETVSHRWQASNEHPLGQIVVVPPPVPNIPATESSTTVTTTDKEQPIEETVTRRKNQRLRKLNELEHERKDQLNQSSLDDLTDREEIEQCLKDLIDTIIANEEVIKQISITIPSNKEHIIEVTVNHDEISDQSETQSNNIETDFIESISRLETSLERMDLFENYCSIQSSEEHIDKTDENEINTTDHSILNNETTTTDSLEQTFINSLLVTSEIIDTSIVEPPSVPTLIKKEKRFCLAHSYSLPPNTIISHMACSNTYIYLCTDRKLIYYTKAPENNVYYSLNWYTYTLPAERVIVSHTNQTIWRIIENRIYSSSDTVRLSALGINWTELNFHGGENLLSISINDQHGWFIKKDGTLWLIRIRDEDPVPMNISCPFNLNRVVCSIDKIAVTTSDGQILVRVECTEDCPEGGGWIFIEHKYGPCDDFALFTNYNIICIIDKKHRIWINDWSLNTKFYEILRNEEFILKITNSRYLININERFLCFTDCREQLYIFSDCLNGIRWSLIEKETRLQRLLGAMPNENYVWALTTDGMISPSAGLILEKPREAQYLTHASFVSQADSENILWALDESCSIYTRSDLKKNTHWKQLDQSQFDWHRRLVDIVCNSVGVWAVDDHGCIHFRHGHSSGSNEFSLLNPAWIQIPGEAKNNRTFSQIFCGPKSWMVYATDNKQSVYARVGIDETTHVGTSWKIIDDCSALGLAVSEHTLWVLTSHGRIQCRENISLTNPLGKRATTLPGRFNSITVSADDEQMWALYPPHHLFKLDRLTILFKK